MTASFIVTLEVDSTSPTDLQEEALRLEEVCQDAGLPIVSVAPWARHDAPNSGSVMQGGATYGLLDIASVLPSPAKPSRINVIKPIEPL